MTDSQAGLSIFDDPDDEATGNLVSTESPEETTQALPVVTEAPAAGPQRRPASPGARRAPTGGARRSSTASPAHVAPPSAQAVTQAMPVPAQAGPPGEPLQRQTLAPSPAPPAPAAQPRQPPTDDTATPSSPSLPGGPTWRSEVSDVDPAAGEPPLPAAPAPEFPVARWGGYDRAAVDKYVASQTGSNAQVQAVSDEVTALRAKVKALQSQLAEQDQPTYAGLGSHAAGILQLAEEQAAVVTASANRAADESRRLALSEAAALRADAEKEAADIRSAHLHEIEERRSSVLAEAQQERTLARAEAQDTLAAAKRAAEQIRLAAQQEANSLRTAARREVEQARAAIDREAMESRRQLAVDKERLTKEAADRHSFAMGETNRLVNEAETRAKAAEDRSREAIAAATKHREQASAEADRSLTRSRREAEHIVTSARRQAEQIVANANANAERQTAAARIELEMLQQRRDGIVTQLAQLRDLVATFASDEPAVEPGSAPD